MSRLFEGNQKKCRLAGTVRHGISGPVLLVVIAILGSAASSAQSQPPASLVETARGKQGVLSPQAEFRGTVFFKRVAEVASEVEGKVVEVAFFGGDRVKRGQLLTRLDDALLRDDLAAAQANLHRNNAELQDVEAKLKRIETLVADGHATQEEFDHLRFERNSLVHQVESSQAQADRIETLLKKQVTYSPFDGVVLERNTEIGEWKDQGDTVAMIASTELLELVADVPESYLRWLTPGESVILRIGKRELKGEIAKIMPRGDIATRTFPVKVSIREPVGLLEGMSGSVWFPIGERRSCLLMPRDALLKVNGEDIAYAVENDTARLLKLKVLGYQGDYVGVTGDGLAEDLDFVVKGNERLRDGAAIRLMPPSTASDQAS